METADIAIVGAGAAGVFAAATIAECDRALRVRVLEKGSAPLEKVGRSGGGRCNLTHEPGDLRAFAQHYPRGSQEMLGALYRFGPSETLAWFESRGISLQIEPDGRVFPRSGNARDVVAALLMEAKRGNIEMCYGAAVVEVSPQRAGFEVRTAHGDRISTPQVLIATGGGAFPAGLDHTLEPGVPSLFPLRLAESGWAALAGTSVVRARVSAAGVSATGPLLITHEGVSGPGVLDLTGLGARRMAELEYRFDMTVDWLPEAAPEETLEALSALRRTAPGRAAGAATVFGLPLRLWRWLLARAGIPGERRWSQWSSSEYRALAAQLRATTLPVSGRAAHRGEFVTCGGVRRREVDFRTMQSRRHAGLFLAGETLDVDGLTGGYNLQAAWTTGRIAAQTIAQRPIKAPDDKRGSHTPILAKPAGGGDSTRG